MKMQSCESLTTFSSESNRFWDVYGINNLSLVPYVFILIVDLWLQTIRSSSLLSVRSGRPVGRFCLHKHDSTVLLFFISDVILAGISKLPQRRTDAECRPTGTEKQSHFVYSLWQVSLCTTQTTGGIKHDCVSHYRGKKIDGAVAWCDQTFYRVCVY